MECSTFGGRGEVFSMSKDLGAFLEDLLGRPPRDDIIEYLSKRGLDGHIGRDVEAEDELAEEYLALESQFPTPMAAGPRVIVIPGDERCAALSRIIAMDASRRADVADFRQKHLKGRLLGPEEVAGWVRARGSAAGGGKTTAEGSVTGAAVGPGPLKSHYAPGRLYYFDKQAQLVRSAGLRDSGPLSELKAISVALCAAHNVWDEPNVATWLLTGTPPPIPLARAEIYRNDLWPAETRAVIVIDPMTPPGLPVRMISEAREALSPVVSQRQPTISRKHAELAVWGESRRGEPRKPWAALLSEWNSEYPDWAYEDRTAEVHFSRDVRSAWVRVTGRAWE